MTRSNRSRWNRAITAAFGTLLLLGVPGAASADHDRQRRTEGPPVFYHGSHCDRSHSSHAQYHGYDRSHRRRYHPASHRVDRHRRGHHEAAYTCRPCSHRFDSQHAFHGHLRRHHHVAAWQLPLVVVHHALGWIFYG